MKSTCTLNNNNNNNNNNNYSFGMHYEVPQCIYRNKNLSWPKITINMLQNTKRFAKNAIKKCYKNAS